MAGYKLFSPPHGWLVNFSNNNYPMSHSASLPHFTGMPDIICWIHRHRLIHDPAIILSQFECQMVVPVPYRLNIPLYFYVIYCYAALYYSFSKKYIYTYIHPDIGRADINFESSNPRTKKDLFIYSSVPLFCSIKMPHVLTGVWNLLHQIECVSSTQEICRNQPLSTSTVTDRLSRQVGGGLRAPGGGGRLHTMPRNSVQTWWFSMAVNLLCSHFREPGC